jgi:hypothetical protein
MVLVLRQFAACSFFHEISERGDVDAAREKGRVVLGCAILMVIEAEDEAYAHVRQQVGVEGGAEVATAADVRPVLAGRDNVRRNIAEEQLMRDDGVDRPVLIAAHVDNSIRCEHPFRMDMCTSFYLALWMYSSI